MFNEVEKVANKKRKINNGGKVVDIYELLSNIDYYSKHIEEVNIGTSDEEQIVAMFVRDPRYGLGYKDLGRELMSQSKLPPMYIVKAGRFDDLFYEPNMYNMNYLLSQLIMNNQLAKKWMPRLTGRNRDLAKAFCRQFEMTEKEYRKFIKCENTVEYKLSYHEYKDDECTHPLVKTINTNEVPIIAYNKYFKVFQNRNLLSDIDNHKILNVITIDEDSNKKTIDCLLKEYKSKVIDN